MSSQISFYAIPYFELNNVKRFKEAIITNNWKILDLEINNLLANIQSFEFDEASQYAIYAGSIRAVERLKEESEMMKNSLTKDLQKVLLNRVILSMYNSFVYQQYIKSKWIFFPEDWFYASEPVISNEFIEALKSQSHTFGLIIESPGYLSPERVTILSNWETEELGALYFSHLSEDVARSILNEIDEKIDPPIPSTNLFYSALKDAAAGETYLVLCFDY